MIKVLLNKIKESTFVALPITALIFLLISFFVPSTTLDKVNLLICFLFLVVGNTLFANGADMSMSQIGQGIGGGLCRTKKIWIMLLGSFLIGFIITFAEPDLQVFAQQVCDSFPGLGNQWAIISIVSLGVAIYFLLAVVKTIFKLSLPVILIISYAIVFVLAFLSPQNTIGMCFDSGAVTTGPISVPFIIAFGLGVASVRWRNKSDEDDFGMIGLASIGPIIAMLIMSLFVKSSTVQAVNIEENLNYLDYFIKYAKEIFLVILPILVIFLISQITMIKLPKRQVKKAMLGIVYTYVGIVIFLVGVSVGYLPLATKIGNYVAGNSSRFWICCLGGLLGFCCVIAEPALQVLKKQVKDLTHGSIKEITIVIFIAIGVCLSAILALIKTFFAINILWFLIPILSISLILGLINTKLFTAISFDSGGVATGAMSVSFILPFVNAIANAFNVGTGFGTVALISSMPILTMQILGLIFKIKLLKTSPIKLRKTKNLEIIDFYWEEK